MYIGPVAVPIGRLGILGNVIVLVSIHVYILVGRHGHLLINGSMAILRGFYLVLSSMIFHCEVTGPITDGQKLEIM